MKKLCKDKAENPKGRFACEIIRKRVQHGK